MFLVTKIKLHDSQSCKYVTDQFALSASPETTANEQVIVVDLCCLCTLVEGGQQVLVNLSCYKLCSRIRTLKSEIASHCVVS